MPCPVDVSAVSKYEVEKYPNVPNPSRVDVSDALDT